MKGYEDGYLDRFFSEGDDLIYVAELEKEVVAFERAHQLYRKLGYWDHEDQGKRIRMVKELGK